MAINKVKRQTDPFLCDGIQTVYPFDFKVFAPTDIGVNVNASSDWFSPDTALTYGTDYAVVLNANQETNPGGKVTLNVAPAEGTRLVVISQITPLQLLTLTRSGGFYPDSLNNAFDKAIAICQELLFAIKRSVSIPVTSSFTSEELLAKIFEAKALADEVIALKSAITRVASVSKEVELVSESIDELVNLANHLEELLNIEELIPLVEGAREYAERAEAAVAKVEEIAKNFERFEELYHEFIEALAKAEGIFDSVDDVRVLVLDTAASQHNVTSEILLREFNAWEKAGIDYIKYLADIANTRTTQSEFHLREHDNWFSQGLASIDRLSDLAFCAQQTTEDDLREYTNWEKAGISKLNKVSEISSQTLQFNEMVIKTFDDDVRMKKLLIRTYVEKPHLLWIVAGQSNAVGSGPRPGYEDASYCAQFWEWSNQSSKALKPLKDPVYRSTRGSAWPEFCRKIFELTGRKSIVLNVASGGADVTGLNIKNTWYQDEIISSPLRVIATREYNDLTDYLKTQSIDYELAGVLWVQGEAECSRIGAGTLDVQAYVNGTLDVFAYLRTLTNTPELPIALAQIGYTKSVLENEALLAGYEAVRKAQLKLCQENQNDFMACELPGTYFKAGYMNDNIHYSQRGYNSMGASFARFYSNNFSFN